MVQKLKTDNKKSYSSLVLKDICVNYSYKSVLKNVYLTFEKGKIYAILGENGAGKSTLTSLLCGDRQPTSGKIFLDDKQVKFNSPKDALNCGIACVHQRPLLADSFSIRDNVKVGVKLFGPTIDLILENVIVGELFKTKKLSKTSTVVQELSDYERFKVAYANLFLKQPSFYIFDEAPLDFLQSSSKDILKVRESIKKSGLTFILISHFIPEIIKIVDKIILLKDGKVLEILDSGKTSESDIKQKLFGIEKNISIPPSIKFEKILEEKVLAYRSGKIKKDINGLKKRIKIGYIPSDKTFRASNPNLTVLQLTTIYHTELKQKELEKYAYNILKKADVNIKLYEKVSSLSGGMLQRIILEREIEENPEVMFLFNPTHGLDSESTQRLYAKLDKLAQSGTDVIIGEPQ